VVEVQFLGSGDAFGSGGRLQTCLHLRGAGAGLFIDCGTSSLIAMKRAGVEASEVGAIIVTHLHGDHFGGLPFLILDGQFRHRELPLVVAGPPGIQARTAAAMEVLFPGSVDVERGFALGFVELAEREPAVVGPAQVTAFPVVHHSGAPSYAVRLVYGGKLVAYSGDTEWTDVLFEVAHGADLFVCEAYFFEKKVRYHLDYRTLEAKIGSLGCRRLVVTHMSQDMLAHLREVKVDCAEDGLVLAL
jgi:ribonuclease BN (tRNA processing enzyme)